MAKISFEVLATQVQVNLCQNLSFLNQVTHNMTRDCLLNPPKNTSSEHDVYKYCFECQNKNKKTIFGGFSVTRFDYTGA